ARPRHPVPAIGAVGRHPGHRHLPDLRRRGLHDHQPARGTVLSADRPAAEEGARVMPAALKGAWGAQLAALTIVALLAYALLLPLFVTDPFSLSGLSILDAFTPPMWMEGGNPALPL